MNGQHIGNLHDQVETIYNAEGRRVFASLVRLIGDFDLAEEALHEAFAAAMQSWSNDGIPENPRSWLVSTGRFKAIDAIRKRSKLDAAKEDIHFRNESVVASNDLRSNEEIEDDRLRLIFTCCHPAIDPKVQVPLTLREVCGLTTDEIANAFLVTPATMAQRIVRGKGKIRDARIPFVIPSVADFEERLESVLSVIYLVFNEGYAASSGDSLTRADLSSEAIRLGRLLAVLVQDSEVTGLLALMLIQESRRRARATPSGDIILLENQNRTLWDRAMIEEGTSLVTQSIASRRLGPYTLQAAIAAVHATATAPEATDWQQIVALYDTLYAIHPSPVIELNRAVAVAMLRGPDEGLTIVKKLVASGELQEFHLLYAVQADLYRRLNKLVEAKAAYGEALKYAKQEPEKRFLTKLLAEL